MLRHLVKISMGTLGALAMVMGIGGVAQARAAAGALAPADSVTVCHDSQLGGSFYCGGAYGTGENDYEFPNGASQRFVVGTDHAVWTIWDTYSSVFDTWTWGSWTSMGGSLWSYVYEDPSSTDGYVLTICATGADGNDWYRTRSDSGGWSDWAIQLFGCIQ